MDLNALWRAELCWKRDDVDQQVLVEHHRVAAGYDLGCSKFSTTQILHLYIHRESIVAYISVAQNDSNLNLARYFSSRYFLESGKFSTRI